MRRFGSVLWMLLACLPCAGALADTPYGWPVESQWGTCCVRVTASAPAADTYLDEAERATSRETATTLVFSDGSDQSVPILTFPLPRWHDNGAATRADFDSVRIVVYNVKTFGTATTCKVYRVQRAAYVTDEANWDDASELEAWAAPGARGAGDLDESNQYLAGDSAGVIYQFETPTADCDSLVICQGAGLRQLVGWFGGSVSIALVTPGSRSGGSIVFDSKEGPEPPKMRAYWWQ